MTEATEGKPSTIVDYWPGDEANDPMAGWYIVELNSKGVSYDAIGPYDTEAEANRVLSESSKPFEVA